MRRRPLLWFLVTLGALYFGLHLALGSSPVQRRVLAELREALSEFGIDLKIESIEFSAFSPKIYLNRVTLSTTQKSPVQLAEPLAIDKVKIQFQPIALISRKIVIDEAIFFHPRILVPRADTLYRKIEQTLRDKKKVNISSPKFTVLVKKIGMVDTLLNIASQDPPFAVRSRSVSLFLENNTKEQRTITADSQQIDIDRGALSLSLSRLALDVDMSQKSLRVNKAIVQSESQQLDVNLIGAASMSGKDMKPESFNANYEIKVPLALLNKIPEIDAPKFAGIVSSSGTIKFLRGNYSGNGTLKYDGISVDDYRFGVGSMAFVLSEKSAAFRDVLIRYANGEIRSQNLSIGLGDRFPLSGELTTKDVRLESLLDSVKSYDNLIRLPLSGTIKAEGFLTGPFTISAQVKQSTSELLVLKSNKREGEESNVVIRIPNARAEGTLVFTAEKMTYQCEAEGLGGKVQGEGYVGFDSSAKVKAHSLSPLSLTELKKIANLKLGGKADINVEVDVPREDELRIGGSIDVSEGEINQLNVGALRGQIFYQNMLLSFENLESLGGEPARGNGFVDFRPKDIHYKFTLDARRFPIDRVFEVFSKRKLSFRVPEGGEVIGGKIIIEGGHDKPDGFEVNATGQSKGFTFYNERWQGADFTIRMRDDVFDLSRVMLLKKSGGIEIRGTFSDKDTKLSLISHGLRLEELDSIGRAPLVGELGGAVTLTDDLRVLPPRGTGEIRLNKVSFRGTPMPDSTLKMQREGNNMEFMVTVAGEQLRGRYVRPLGQADKGTVLLYFKEFDFAPLLSVFLGKDVPTLTEVAGTGDLSFTGNLNDWKTVKGSGSVTLLRLGLKGTPMTNKSPLEIQIADGAVKVERFHLVGTDSQLSLDYLYRPNQAVQASLDGKVDLQYLQPFIPGLDYGTGKVSVGLRMSGHPSRFELLGNATLEDGVFRLSGLNDELRSVQAQVGISQDKLSVDRFEATVGGGNLLIAGEVKIDRFRALAPDLKLQADRISMRFQNALSTTLTGGFSLKGTKMPYLLSGQCRLDQATLTRLDAAATSTRLADEVPSLSFDIQCEAKEKLLVATEIMNAEFRGNFHLLGNTQRLGLLGNADAISGSLLFRETKFTLNAGTVKFEASDSIAPRFNISGRSVVRETRALVPQDYEISLQAFGTPADYKIRLSSTPALAESEITSLLLLGVTNRSSESNTGGSYLDLGTAIAAQIPLQSKIQSELGVDIKINTQTVKDAPIAAGSTAADNGVSTVPSVQIQKDITKKTRLYYSKNLDSAIPIQEFKIEHALDDNFTVNATTVDRATTETQSSKSYGLDFRYRFSFE